MSDPPAHDLWSLAEGAMTLLMEGEHTPENLVSALKTFNRVMAEAPDESDALMGALYSAGCVYAILGDIERSNEYILASGFFDQPHAEVQ